ncbi:MAG: hypothetical protein AAGJ96_09850 [Pseudomonadota bacterium]
MLGWRAKALLATSLAALAACAPSAEQDVTPLTSAQAAAIFETVCLNTYPSFDGFEEATAGIGWRKAEQADGSSLSAFGPPETNAFATVINRGPGERAICVVRGPIDQSETKLADELAGRATPVSNGIFDFAGSTDGSLRTVTTISDGVIEYQINIRQP